MNIRPATLDDAAAYYDHMVRHFAESGKDGDVYFHPIVDYADWVKEEQVAKLIDDWKTPIPHVGWQKVWIAENEEGLVVGDCVLRSGMMAATAHRCQYGIGIERAARGKGLGRRLSIFALTWARQQKGLDWMDLWVFSENAAAIKLYETLGFQRVDAVRDQFRIDGQKIDDIHMTLPLAR